MITLPKPVMPVNRTQSTASLWLVLGDDETIIKKDRIVGASTDGRMVIMTIDTGSHIIYNALSTEKAKQEIKEIINILLQRNTNENSKV